MKSSKKGTFVSFRSLKIPILRNTIRYNKTIKMEKGIFCVIMYGSKKES